MDSFESIYRDIINIALENNDFEQKHPRADDGEFTDKIVLEGKAKIENSTADTRIKNHVLEAYSKWEQIRDEKIEKFLYPKINQKLDEWDTLPTHIAKEYAKNVIAVLKSSEVETYRPDLISFFQTDVETYTRKKLFEYAQKVGTEYDEKKRQSLNKNNESLNSIYRDITDIALEDFDDDDDISDNLPPVNPYELDIDVLMRNQSQYGGSMLQIRKKIDTQQYNLANAEMLYGHIKKYKDNIELKKAEIRKKIERLKQDYEYSQSKYDELERLIRIADNHRGRPNFY